MDVAVTVDPNVKPKENQNLDKRVDFVRELNIYVKYVGNGHISNHWNVSNSLKNNLKREEEMNLHVSSKDTAESVTVLVRITVT